MALAWLRADEMVGRAIVLWLLAVVWAGDVGAYAFGRWIGGLRLVPAISPHKTWAGLLGGIACAGAVGAVAALLSQQPIAPMVVGSAVVGLVAQLGDLVESWVKRRFKVKDSSNLIPGHGGLLDRVDGLLVAATTVALFGLVHKDGILKWL